MLLIHILSTLHRERLRSVRRLPEAAPSPHGPCASCRGVARRITLLYSGICRPCCQIDECSEWSSTSRTLHGGQPAWCNLPNRGLEGRRLPLHAGDLEAHPKVRTSSGLRKQRWHKFLTRVMALCFLPAQYITPIFRRLKEDATAALTPLLQYGAFFGDTSRLRKYSPPT